ncbi:MAG: hypothetical protein HYX55_01825 [Chloroflexi bacterium]|nr:hypothetical protein [Chloroflexota bacterium]
MRYAIAPYVILLEHEQAVRNARDARNARDLQLAREASPTPSLRRRAGEAVIAFGVRLAGDARPVRDERRLAARPS